MFIFVRSLSLSPGWNCQQRDWLWSRKLLFNSWWTQGLLFAFLMSRGFSVRYTILDAQGFVICHFLWEYIFLFAILDGQGVFCFHSWWTGTFLFAILYGQIVFCSLFLMSRGFSLCHFWCWGGHTKPPVLWILKGLYQGEQKPQSAECQDWGCMEPFSTPQCDFRAWCLGMCVYFLFEHCWNGSALRSVL